MLQKLIDYPDDFTGEETRLAFQHLARKEFGGATEVQIGAFLMALKYSGKAHDDVIISANKAGQLSLCISPYDQ